MSRDFKRQDSVRHLRLGKKKRVIKWRKPKGKHSKMRLKRKSYPSIVSIGRKKSAIGSEKLRRVVIYNANDLTKLSKNSVIILGKVGAKKKLELIKLAREKNIPILNVKGEPRKNEIRR